MPNPKERRRLAAILAADVVGYSRLMEADETGTLERLKAARAEILDPAVTEFGGNIVKTTGDGLLVEFPSAVDAVQCALTVQSAMRERGQEEREADRLAFRIGVHLGDVIVEEDDIYGDGVNLAVRLEGLAEPGGICISGTTRDILLGPIADGFADAGPQTVKNIERPIRIWRWRGEDAVSGEPAPALPDRPSLAVLPFANMSGDAEQEFFADGMTEDIITLLSTVPGLFVISRNSSFAYKGQTPDIRKTAKALGVRYVLEGSVRRAGNRIRVTAQFVDARTGNPVWAERYDRELADIFAVQDEVAQGIAGALQSRLLIAESENLRRARPETLDAWGNVVKAKVNVGAFGRDDLDAAEPFARRALELDPSYAEAHAVLGNILAWRAYCNWTDDWKATAREGLQHAERALEIERHDPAVLADAGVALWAIGRFQRAIEVLERAVELNPNAALTCAFCGFAVAAAGRADDGVVLCERALRLSPRDPLEYIFHALLGGARFFARDFEAARAATARAIGLNPQLFFAHLFHAASCARLGDIGAAREALARVEVVSETAIPFIFRSRSPGPPWDDYVAAIAEAMEETAVKSRGDRTA